MDPISIAASAAGLATLAAALVQAVDNCIERIKTAESVLRIFASELSTLQNTLGSIDAALRRPNFKDILRKAASSQHAGAQLSSLDGVLSECRSALADLEALLASIKSGRLARGFLKTPAAAWKLNSKTPELGRIQSLVRTYNAAMQIHLQIMTLLISTDANATVHNVDESLTDIKTEILRLRFQLHRPTQQENVAADDDARATSAIIQSLSTSETILSSASEYLGSIVGTIRADATVVDFSAGDAAQIEQWMRNNHDKDPDAYSSDDEDTDYELIFGLRSLGEKHYANGNYSIAKRFYTKYLDEMEDYRDFDYCRIYETRLNLAICHSVEKEYTSARDALEAVHPGSCSREQKLQIQQYLAELPFYARTWRKQRHRTAYYNAATLLATIYTHLGETEAAAVYQDKIPPNWQPSRIKGWPAPDQQGEASSRTDSVPAAASGSVLAYIGLLAIKTDIAPLSVKFSPDGTKMLSYTSGAVQVWDTQTGRALQTIPVSRPIQSVVYSPDGSKIAGVVGLTLLCNNLKIWDSSSGNLFQDLCNELNKEQLRWLCVAFSPDGSKLAAGDKQSGVFIWSTHSGRLLNQLQALGRYSTNSIGFSPNGGLVVFASGSLIIWDTVPKSQPRIFYANTKLVSSASISPDGKEVVSNGCDHQILIWNLHSGIVRQRLRGHRGWVNSVTFSSDGRRVVSGAIDETVRIWDTQSGEQLHKIKHSAEVLSVDISQDGETLVYGGADNTINIVEVHEWM